MDGWREGASERLFDDREHTHTLSHTHTHTYTHSLTHSLTHKHAL
jgi:hypothetical protein